jgi:hypothetical protein
VTGRADHKPGECDWCAQCDRHAAEVERLCEGLTDFPAYLRSLGCDERIVRAVRAWADERLGALAARRP